MSGNERNCCFLNTLASPESGNRFATVSAVSGLDFADDGQAAARVDWDHDGDIDLLLSNRNAPRIRFMRNNAPASNDFVLFQLIGNGQDTNRNAIGAQVVVTLESEIDEQEPVRLIKSLHAGDGYLTQSTRWLHFGLGANAKIAQVQVRWPNRDGTVETFENVMPNQRYQIVQGTGNPEPMPSGHENLSLEPRPVELPPTDLTMRIPLVHQFAAPTLEYTDYQGTQKVFRLSGDEMILVNLWSTTCVPCVKELTEFTERHDELTQAGIRVLALSVDDLQDMQDARQQSEKMAQRMSFPFASGMATESLIADLERLHKALIKLERALPMPTSFLIDREGRLNTIYKGTVSVDTLLADAKPQNLNLMQRYQRAAAFKGTVLDNPLVNERMARIETSALIRLGKDYVNDRQLDKAERAFQDALAQFPESASINNELALVYDVQGKNQLAATYYRNALNLKPDNAALNINLAQVLIRLREYEEAAKCLDHAIEIEPDNADAHYNRGVVYSTQRDVTREQACYEKAIEIRADHAQALFRMGRIYERQPDLQQAKTYYERALNAAPGRAPILTGLARVVSSGGDTGRAEKLLKEAILREPRYAEARFQMGRLLSTIGRVQEARQHYMATLQINRNHQGAIQALQQLQ